MLGGSPLIDPNNNNTATSQQQQQQQQPSSADVLSNIWSQQQSPIIDSVATTPIGMIRNADQTFMQPSNNLVSNSTTYNTNNNQNTSSNNNNVTSISASTMGTSQTSASGVSTLSAYGDGAVVAKVASPVTATTGPAVKRRNQIVTPEMAYASATKPFSYADGYHYLINYVKTR